MEQFVREYLQACQSNDIQRELAFYAPTLRYFDHGLVKLPFVERDVENYYRHWPHREFTLLSLTVTPRKDAPNEFVARFRIHFSYRAEGRRAEGQTDNAFGVRDGGGTLKFTSLREAAVRG